MCKIVRTTASTQGTPIPLTASETIPTGPLERSLSVRPIFVHEGHATTHERTVALRAGATRIGIGTTTKLDFGGRAVGGMTIEAPFATRLERDLVSNWELLSDAG